MKLTADTIPDVQIRHLHRTSLGNEPVRIDCHVALFGSGAARAEARARCAQHYDAGPSYSDRAGRALAAVDGWTGHDFIDLALAAADQAGASIEDLERIAEILNARAEGKS